MLARVSEAKRDALHWCLCREVIGIVCDEDECPEFCRRGGTTRRHRLGPGGHDVTRDVSEHELLGRELLAVFAGCVPLHRV